MFIQLPSVYFNGEMRVRVLILTLLFCLVSLASLGQKSRSEELMNSIQSNISAGYLTEAQGESDELKRLNPDQDSFYNKMSILLSARISCLEGNYSGMYELLKGVDKNDEDPIIRYYWKDYFARYSLENDRFKIGVNALQESIELANSIHSNIRVDIRKSFSELYIIYYTESVERKLNNGDEISERVEEIFQYLEKNKGRMEPFEKQFLYSYRLFFADPRDTTAIVSMSKANVDFGNKYDQPISVIVGEVRLAKYHWEIGDTLTAEKYLVEAEKKSKEVESLLYSLIPPYELMVHYKNRGQYEKAVEWGRKAQFPKGTNFSTYLDVYGQLSECFEELGEVDSVLKWMKVDNRKFREISRLHDRDMQEFYIDQQRKVIIEKNEAIVKIRWIAGLLILTLVIILFLWRRNKRINRELSAKNQSLELSLQTMENFSHILSHDLRAPIHSIRNLTENILEEDIQMSEDSKESLQLIHLCSSNSIALITNIMVYIRSKNVEMTKEHVECEEIFSTVQSNLLYEIVHSGAQITITDGFPETIYGNKVLLIQLFQNLIQNAIKYRREGLVPEVKLSFESNQNAEEIRIVDNGMGIKPDKVNGLLDAFAQSEFSSIEKGIGLGLSISRNIMRLHDGDITISSEHGESTTVCLIFPKRSTVDLTKTHSS